ncbi:MAG: hypothetical protein AB1634_03990 [Thermodesulfobacteriota bacterium]
MRCEAPPDLAGFVATFLEQQGAVVERQPDSLEAILPAALATTLGTSEHLQLAEGAGAGLGFGSLLLERLVTEALAGLPVAGCRLSFEYVKTQGFDRLVAEQLFLSRAKGQVKGQARALGQYLWLTARYLAASDEQREGQVSVLANLETGVPVPDMAERLLQTPKDYVLEPGPTAWTAGRLDRLLPILDRRIHQAVTAAIEPFVASMTRRLHRDLASLKEYYTSLGREMTRGLARAGLSDALRQDRQAKIEALPQELARKEEDLVKKYSLRVAVQPAAVMLIQMPVARVLYEVAVGRAKKDLSLTYNPLTKALEPVACEGCGGGLTRGQLCPAMHLLCPACGPRCPRCAGDPARRPLTVKDEPQNVQQGTAKGKGTGN